MHLKKGFRLNNGKYEILEVLGQGGFGITYNAEGKTSLQGELGSIEVTAHVAIKEFFFKDYCERDSNSMRVTISSTTGKELFQRFKEKLVKEAIILSKLNHPNIIRVIEIFEENNTAYMVMEFVEGNSLLDKLNEQGTIPVCQSIDYTSQIGVALSYVHTQNILHLDVKPSNILIRKKDDRALLIDFGVSKRYSPEHKETSMTPVGRSKGYAPPEQYIDKGTALFAPSLDVYSLGATLYHCITGVIPPEPYEILEYGLALPSELNTILSGNFEQAILKAMALKKADRFQTVEEFIHAIKDTGKSKQETEPDKKPSVVLYAGETRLDNENPVSSGSGKEPETPPKKPPQTYSGETEHDNGPPKSFPPVPPAKSGEPSKKPDPGHSWLGWIIAGAIFVGFGVTIYSLYNRNQNDKAKEEKRIADSIRVADSILTSQNQKLNSDSGTFIDDRDGQKYKWVKIDNQIWMAENLSYMPKSGKYWAYDNKNENKLIYGYLYDWNTAKQVCPIGWHLPSDDEWNQLVNFFAGEQVAASKLKSKTYCENPDIGAPTNSGFEALLGGFRYCGTFCYIGKVGYWWSATEYDKSFAWYREIRFNDINLYRSHGWFNYAMYGKRTGFSVRCIRNN